MFVNGSHVWIKYYKDVMKLEDAKLNCPIVYSHNVKDGDTEYACFIPSVRELNGLRMEGAVYINRYHVEEALEKLNAEVICDIEGTETITTPEGIIINGKFRKFKRDSEWAYKIQKTQYKGKTAYCIMAGYAVGATKNWLIDGLKQAEYID